MKVIATGYQKQRLIIDAVDQTTAFMASRVLNDREEKMFYERAQAERPSWFYQAVPDDYRLRSEAV